LRVVGGERVEITFQDFHGYNPFDPSIQAHSTIYHADWLPAVSLVYEVTPKSNLRFGFSQTLARPQLRELSPALSTSSAGDLQVRGNPGLKITSITNLDARFEYFPTLREVLAVSVFYKHFKDPIEEFIGSTGYIGFLNVPKADLIGAELEARKSLESLAAPLRDFSVIANLTLVKSEVKFGDLAVSGSTDNRPLSYQSPYVINLSADYSNQAQGLDIRLLYNVLGPRITVTGSNFLPDTYELPRHMLDFTAAKRLASNHLELKAQVLNILGAATVFAYRDHQGYRYDGTNFQSLGRQPETRRYNTGTTVAATATYTY